MKAVGVRHAPIEVRLPADDRFAADMLEGLVRIESLSGQERAASEWLVAVMRGLGLRAHVDEAGSAVGIIGDDSPEARELVLLGHIDTVPGRVPVRREGDLLFGRGTVDAKGPLAAFVMAAATAKLGPGVRVVVIGAVEEEAATSKGARLAATQYRPAACIIGEPSGADGVTLGYKGRLLAELSVTRAGAHSAGPQGSAADVAIEWWSRVCLWASEATDGASRVFDQVQCSVRSMTTSSDGMADSARLVAGFRLPLEVSPQEVEAACLAAAAALGEGIQVTFRGHELAHASDRSDPVVALLSAAIRDGGATPRPKLKTGTSDMNVVAPIWKCPIAAYGPGDSSLDHTPNEHISISEYLRSIQVLRRVVEGFGSAM